MGQLSKDLLLLKGRAKGRALNIKELFSLAGPRAPALITAVCSVPFLFFVPLPGLSTILGVIVAIAGFAIATSRPVWFPKFMLKKKMSPKTIAKILSRGAVIFKKLEKIVRPRKEHFYRNPFCQKLNGYLILICGIILLLPLPPGTNFTPGLTCFLISIGMLEEDGLFVLFGYVSFLLNIALFIFLPIFGLTELHKITH